MPSRRMHWLGAVWCMIVAIMPSVAFSANRTWNGAATTDFWWSGNWGGGVAPLSDLTTDVGVFAGTVTANQPQLTSSGSINGLSYTTTSGGWTLGSNASANVLTLGASGITTAGQASGTNTISANLAIGATQTWQVGTGGTLRITGGVSMGSAGTPAATTVTIGAGTNNGSLVFDPAAGSNIALYYQGTPSGTATAVLTITKPTLFGGALNSSSGTNVISHATSSGIGVSAGGSLTVNSGVWQTNDIGVNANAAMAGEVRLNGGTLAAGGSRYMLTISNTAAGQWTVDGGTLRVSGSTNSGNSSNSTFQLGGSVAQPPSAPLVGNFNLRSGLVDVAKAGTTNQVGAAVATVAPSVLMNHSGGVAQFGVTTASNVFTGATNSNTSNNLAIGHAGSSTTGVKAAYTLTGGRLLVAGALSGNAPTVGGGGISNFNFMGGMLTVGTITATNLGSSGTATATSNQVSSSDNIGTFVNYGGVLAPGGDALTITNDQYGNSSIATTAVAGRTAITGNYVVGSANAALAVNISGTTASTIFQEAANSGRFSQVTVSGIGTNTLGGNLLVSLIPGSAGTTFAPASADTFKIVSFTGAGATNSGTFAGNNVAGGKVIATDGLTAFGITYVYTASSGGVTLGSATANEWKAASGSDWNTAGSWTAMAPNTSAFIARFADSPSATGANSVSLASNLTIQGIQLASTSRQYTISTSNGSGLTLDASPRNTTNLMTNATTAATAQITDSSGGVGNHTIGVPLTLASDLAVSVSNAANSLTISGGIAGTGRSVAKTGAGMLVLSGSSAYSGSTTVTAGRLRIDSAGSLNSTSGITINGAGAEFRYNSATALSAPLTLTQGTLSGSGAIGTAVSVGGGAILSPGNSPGSQAFTQGLTFGQGGQYTWEMNDAASTAGTGWDILNVSGGSGLQINAISGSTFRIAITSLSGTAAGNAANFSATKAGSWTIVSSASGVTNFQADRFTLDRSAFANTSSGSFTLSQVASGGNQTLVLAYNTISALTSSTTSVTGFRVMQNQSTTTSINLLNGGPNATDYTLSPSAGLSLAGGSTGTLTGSGAQAIGFGYASTASTGARSATLSFTNTGNANDAAGTVNVSGAVVANRVVTASQVDFGLVRLGAVGTGTSTFTSAGSDNDYTRITVGNGSGGGFTVSGSNGFVFDGSGGSSRTLAGTFSTAGAISGTISLTNSSAEAGGSLAGQSPGSTSVVYSASVFSGTGSWNKATGGSWGSGGSADWTSAEGVAAAPGTFAGYANTDVATFGSTVASGTATVSLNGAQVSLASLAFNNSAARYVIATGTGSGSLTLAKASGKPAIDVVGTHEIAAAILGSSGLQKTGVGKLILSGSSNYSGGTDVAAGTLAVNGSLAGNVAVAAGAVLGGSGSIAGVLSGAGLVGPGNSPGILTASQFDPSSGLDAAFEFMALAPVYSSASASLNDVLRLTNASNPFASASFTAGNVIDVYFNVDSIASGQVYEGGFFTGLSAESLLAALDGKATFNYWAKTTGIAERSYGGTDYVSLTSMSGITGATFQTASVIRDFGAGIGEVAGSVTQFVIVPEPDTIIFAGIGIAMAGWSLCKRLRRTP